MHKIKFVKPTCMGMPLQKNSSLKHQNKIFKMFVAICIAAVSFGQIIGVFVSTVIFTLATAVNLIIFSYLVQTWFPQIVGPTDACSIITVDYLHAVLSISLISLQIVMSQFS